MGIAEVVDNILEHHGVKGMQWGVRRKATVGPQEVIVSDKRKKFKTSGGSGHPGSSEAVSARRSGQIAKKSGVKALTNAELRSYNERLNLEQNYKRLSFSEKSAGERFVRKLLGQSPKFAQNQWKDEEFRKRAAAGAAAVVLRAGVAAA